MRRLLLLLRHAEAEPARAGLEDRERALTERGRLEALEAAQSAYNSHRRVDLLLASPARRARETAQIIAAQLDMAAAPSFEPELYPGVSAALLATLRRCSDTLQVVLLVSHNPGLSELLARLSADKTPHTLSTCGLSELGFNGSWQNLGERTLERRLLR